MDSLIKIFSIFIISEAFMTYDDFADFLSPSDVQDLLHRLVSKGDYFFYKKAVTHTIRLGAEIDEKQLKIFLNPQRKEFMRNCRKTVRREIRELERSIARGLKRFQYVNETVVYIITS